MNLAGGGGIQSGGAAAVHKKPTGYKPHPAGGGGAGGGFHKGMTMSRHAADRSNVGGAVGGGEIHNSRDNSDIEEDYEGDYVDTSIAPVINIDKYTVLVWESDHDLIAVRHLATESFRQQWDKGIQAYIAGIHDFFPFFPLRPLFDCISSIKSLPQCLSFFFSEDFYSFSPQCNA